VKKQNGEKNQSWINSKPFNETIMAIGFVKALNWVLNKRREGREK